jgi:hypothetical protein
MILCSRRYGASAMPEEGKGRLVSMTPRSTWRQVRERCSLCRLHAHMLPMVQSVNFEAVEALLGGLLFRGGQTIVKVYALSQREASGGEGNVAKNEAGLLPATRWLLN